MASIISIPTASHYCHLSLAKKDQAKSDVSAGPVEYCPECIRIDAFYDAMSYGTPTPMEELSLLSDDGSETSVVEPFRVLADLPDNLFAPAEVCPSASSPALPSAPTPTGAINEKPVEDDVDEECSFSLGSFCVSGDADINGSFCGQDFQGKLTCPSDLDEIPEIMEQPEPTTPSSEAAPAPCKLLTVAAILTSTTATAIKSGNSSLIVPSKAMKRFIPQTNSRPMPQHAKHTEDQSFALAELSKESMLIEKDINALFELTCAAPSSLPTLAAKSKTAEDVSLVLAQLSYESLLINATMGPLPALVRKRAPVKAKRTAKKSASKDDTLPLPDISAGSLLLANCSAFRRELAAVGPSVDIKPLKAPKKIAKAVQTIKKPSQAVKSKASALAKPGKTSTSTKSTAPTTATSVVGAKAKAAAPIAAKPLKGRTSAIVPPTKAAAPKVAAVKPRESSTPMVLRSRISIANAPKTTVAPKVVKAVGAATASKTAKAAPKPVTAAATAAPRTTEARKGLKTAVKHSLPAPASKPHGFVEWTPARKVKTLTLEDCGFKGTTPLRDVKRRTSPIWLRGSGTPALTTVQEKPLSLEDASFEAEVLMEDQDQDYLAFKTGATKQA
jgi:hypothetical protein